MTAWDGRPENPERNGWHWVCIEGREQPVYWWQRFEDVWEWSVRNNPVTINYMAQWAKYLGPCLLPAKMARDDAPQKVAVPHGDDFAARMIEAAARAIIVARYGDPEDGDDMPVWIKAHTDEARAALAAAVREASPPDKPILRYAATHLDRAANDVDGVGFQSNAADLRRVAALLRALAEITNG